LNNILIQSFIPVIIFFLLYFFKDPIAKSLKLYDTPNKKIKFHKKKTPKLGGLILILNGLIILYFSIMFKENIFFKIILLTILCSLVGLLDDIIDISPYKKFIILTSISITFLLFNHEFRIEKIIFENIIFQKIIILQNTELTSIFLTILCYLLIINAYNMSDGHNGIASFIALSWFFYFLIYKSPIYFFLTPIIICIFLIFIFNIKSKIFLGDSGNYFISVIFASLIINQNNITNNFFAEEIFILFMLPGIDMLRLFILRIVNKKNPFKGDRQHLHHYLKVKFKNDDLVLVSYIIFFLFPIMFLVNKFMDNILTIIFFISIYLISLIKIKKNK
jgi:UDP-GlcNAc:undecaprenyl-phosphate GlcNAc-1-phosphate transferase